MRIYLDVCCLNRPFDDQTQNRIHLESEAVLNILTYCQNGIWDLVSSEVIEFEISKTSDEERRLKVLAFVELASEKLYINEATTKRALELESLGFRAADALHLACAEEANVDIFLSTDDRLLKKSQQVNIKIKVANPLIWLMETEE